MYDLLTCICNYSPILAPFSRYSTLHNVVTLKSRLRVTRGRWKLHHSVDRIRVPISVP